MASFDSEQLMEQAFERLNESAQRDPRVCPWGLFAWGDAPPACGGGVGAFQWFETLEDLMEFITDWSAAEYMSFDNEAEWLEQRQCLRSIVSQWQADPVSTVQNLNKELKGLIQIDWIGSFAELKAGKVDFSRRIQEAFTDYHLSEVSSSTSENPEKEAQAAEHSFIRFLAEYGM